RPERAPEDLLADPREGQRLLLDEGAELAGGVALALGDEGVDLGDRHLRPGEQIRERLTNHLQREDAEVGPPVDQPALLEDWDPLRAGFLAIARPGGDRRLDDAVPQAVDIRARRAKRLLERLPLLLGRVPEREVDGVLRPRSAKRSQSLVRGR